MEPRQAGQRSLTWVSPDPRGESGVSGGSRPPDSAAHLGFGKRDAPSCYVTVFHRAPNRGNTKAQDGCCCLQPAAGPRRMRVLEWLEVQN